MATLSDYFSKVPYGLPDRLLKVERGTPHAIMCIPNFNRAERRSFVHFLRKQMKSKADDTRLLMRFLSDPRQRLMADWIHFEELEKGRDSCGLPPSLDIALLRCFRRETDLFAFDSERFAASCRGWEEVRQSLEENNQKSIRVLPATGLKFLNLWPELERQLNSFKDLEIIDAERVADAVFALSSMTGSPWFMNEAARLHESILRYYDDMYSRHVESREEREDNVVVRSELAGRSASGQLMARDITLPVDQTFQWNSPVVPEALLHAPGELGPHALLSRRISEIATMLAHPMERWTNLDTVRAILSHAVQVLESTGATVALKARQIHLRAEISRVLSTDVEPLQPFENSLDVLKSAWLEQTDGSDDVALESRLTAIEARLTSLLPLMDAVRAAAATQGAASAAVVETRELARDPKDFAARRMLAEKQTAESAAALELVSAQEALMCALEAHAVADRDSMPTSADQLADHAAESALEAVATQVQVRPDKPVVEPTPGSALDSREVQVPVDKESAPREASIAIHSAVGPTPKDRTILDQPVLASHESSLADHALTSATRVHSEVPSSAGAAFAVEPIAKIQSAPQAVSEPRPDAHLASAMWRAIWLQETATAYQIAHLTDRLGEVSPISAPLARALTLSPLLLHPNGPVAGDLRETLAAIDPDGFPGSEDAKQAQHLMLLAALLRPLLLAPDSTTPALAERLHLPDGVSEVYELFRNFTSASARVRHLRLDARAFAAIRDAGAWQTQMKCLQDEVRAWRDRAPHLTVKFHAGTVIWREWQKPGGEIDQLLAPVQKNEPASIPVVRAQYERLTNAPLLAAAIDGSDRKLKLRGDRIHGSALEQLELRVSEATELAGRWLALTEARPIKQGGQGRHLEAVRNAIASRRDLAIAQLKAREASSDPVVAASARMALLALDSTWQLFEPTAELKADEPDVALVLNRPLLALPAVRLAYDWTIKSDMRAARDNLVDTAGRLPPLAKSLDTRLEAGDIVGATRLVELISTDDAGAAAMMRGRLEAAAREFWQGLAQKLSKLYEAIESSVVYGLINEAERERFESRLQALNAQVQDLACVQNIQDDVGELASELDTLGHRRRDELKAALEGVRSKADPSDCTLVEQAIAVGDLPSAAEYLSRLSAGQRITGTTNAPRDPFTELYGTTVAADIEKFLTDVGRNPNQWRETIERSSGIGELSYADVADVVRTDAARMTGLWLELKRTSAGAASLGDRRLKTMQSLLTLLGFTDVRMPRPKGGSVDLFEAEFETETIADRSVCPIPYFGSAAQGRYRAVFFQDRASADQIITRIGPTVTARPIIVFFFGKLTDRLRRELAAESRRKHRSFVIIDEVLLTFLTAERGSRLAALFGVALPLSWSDPYITTASVMPPELFFGRQVELRRLLDPMKSCFVYGGRQLGKTALLKTAERHFHAPDQDRYAAYIDLKASHVAVSSELDSAQVWRPIYRKLTEIGLLPESMPEPKSEGKVDDFVGRVESLFREKPQVKLLLLLDEADRFLEGDARHEYVDTVRLKRLMESTGRRIKIVLAGLHDVLRTAEQANHPLAHFGEPIEIGPLISPSEWREAQQLVRGPLAASGFAFEREGMVDRILAQTNFYPSLIQLYCSKLMARMMEEGRFNTAPRYIIRESKLDETYLARDLRDEIRNKFRLTLQLDPRYAVIAYAIAYRSYQHSSSRAGSFSVQDLTTMARSWWADGFARTTDHGFRIILEEMVGLGVLRKMDDGSFTLRNQNLLLLMGTEEEVGDVLSRDRDLPEEFAASEFHSTLEGPGAVAGRHPLSLTQLGALSSRGHAVVLIGGTRASGVDVVYEALLSQAGEASARRLPICTDDHSFAEHLSGLADKVEKGATIALVPSDTAWTPKWIERALEILKKLPQKAKSFKTVFIIGPERASQPEIATLSERNCVVWQTLAPWSDGFVRHWLEDGGKANGPAERERLRLQTGYWPGLFMQSAAKVELARFTGGHATLDKLVIGLAEYADSDQSASLSAPELAALTEVSVESAAELLKFGERLGIFIPVERDSYRLEVGLLNLLASGAVTRD